MKARTLLLSLFLPLATVAAPVQITFDGNLVAGFPVNDTIDTDFTGDGVSDMPLLQVLPYEEVIPDSTFTTSSWEIDIKNSGTTLGFASFTRTVNTSGTTTFSSAAVKTFGEDTVIASSAASTIGSFPITFSDQRINGGAVTEGVIEIRASSYGPPTGAPELSVELVRLIFDDADVDLAGPVDLFASFSEWVPSVRPDNSALIRALNAKLVKLNKKTKQALRKKQSAKVRRFLSQARKIQAQISAL